MKIETRKAAAKPVLQPVSRSLLVVTLMLIGIFSCGESDITSAGKDGEIGKETLKLLKNLDIIKAPNNRKPDDFSLLDLNGKKVYLSDFKGKIVFLNFWTTWCPPCREEMPSMEKLHNRLKDKDFAMIAVNLSEPRSLVEKFFKKHRLTFTALLDLNGDLGTPFGIRSIPTTYILDRDQTILGKALGPRNWGGDESVALFEHLIENGSKS